MMRFLPFAIAALSVCIGPALSETQGTIDLDTSALPEMGTVSQEAGLKAWQRIYDVVSHPRCDNCHVGPDNIPVWSGPSYGERRPHGMAINAGESRIGAESLSCSSCHQSSTLRSEVPRAAPRSGMFWQLAPVEFQWIDKTEAEICRQIRDPERNGGRDAADLVDHILHDAELFGFISWSFDPGPNREPAPGSLQAHLEDMAAWTAAGMPCPYFLPLD